MAAMTATTAWKRRVTQDLDVARRSALASASLRCYSPPPASFPPLSPILDEQRTPDPTHRGHRPVHGEHGFDRDRHLAAGDRGGYWREPPDAETCHHLVSAVAGGIYSGERLDRRSFWRADGVLDRGRGLYRGLDRLRAVLLRHRLCDRPHRAGVWRCDDDAGGAAGAAALDRQERAGQRDGLGHGAGAGRTGDWAAARRLHHDLPDLALDLPDQHSDRAARHRDGAALHRPDPQRGPRALRSLRTGAGRDRAWRHRGRTFDRRPQSG